MVGGGANLSERRGEGKEESGGREKDGLTTGNEGHVPEVMRKPSGEVTENGNGREEKRRGEERREERREHMKKKKI